MVATSEIPRQRRPSQIQEIRSRVSTFRQSVCEHPVIKVLPEPPENVEHEVVDGPDGGYGWVVLVAGFFCVAVLDGYCYCFGIFLDDLVKDLKVSRSTISLTGSLLAANSAFVGPITAMLVSKYGTRKICMFGSLMAGIGLLLSTFQSEIIGFIICYSVMTGLGFGLMYLPCIVAVANHFVKLRSLAIGILMCGSAAGSFMLAPLESYLEGNYDWLMAFRVTAGLCLLACACAVLLRPVEYVEITNPEVDAQREDQENRTVGWIERIVTLIIDKDLYRHNEYRFYLLVMAADIFATLGIYIPYHHLPPVAIEAGLSKEEANFLISVIGISSSVARIGMGYFCGKQLVHPITICAAVMTAIVPAVLCCTIATSYPVFIVLAAIFGLCTGSWVVVMSPLLVRILGLPLLNPAYGLVTGIRGIATVAGPPFAASAVEYFTSRAVAMYMCGLSMGLSALIFTAGSLWNKGKTRRGYTQI